MSNFVPCPNLGRGSVPKIPQNKKIFIFFKFFVTFWHSENINYIEGDFL